MMHTKCKLNSDFANGAFPPGVLLTQNLTEYDEINVNMYWETMDSFTAWRNSDAFKSAHKRPEPDEAKKESPILGSEIITYEVASVKELSR